MDRIKAYALSIGILLAVPLCPIGVSAEGVCTQTTRAALRACLGEGNDDYWIGYGNCLNLGDDEVSNECFAETIGSGTEKREECRTQMKARDEVCDALGQEAYSPLIDPANFVLPATAAANPNTYWPLIPGAEWVYENEEEEITVTVTGDTIEILGVVCTIVRDVVVEDGEPVEDTLDFYAQDNQGNVWYFGEISKNFEDGLLSDLDGSWRAGVDFAKPGILMKAAPVVGDIYRQEFLLGEAEDIAEVVSTTASESATAANCTGDCLQTKEYTPIEPGEIEYKYYAPGIGLILEEKPESGERLELISFFIP